VNNLPVNLLPVGYSSQSHGQSSYSSDDLPKTAVLTLNQGSNVKSMDFHPLQQIVLLVGTNMGDVMVWDIGSRERIAHRNFKASLSNEYTASVNRVVWSPDGTLC
ncbi:topless-related protein 4-like, partial [Trifolium medium]|nr:topless-related protein 4-like [Trifolium medium]